MNITETQIQDSARNVLHKSLIDIQMHSGGAYSHVYKSKDEATGTAIIVKIYLKNGFMQQEIRELEELRKYSGVAVPQVYGYHFGDENINDMFFMESMPGIPVRYISFDNETEKKRIADAVVDAHIALHNVINPNGFGDLDCDVCSRSWETLFRNRIDGYYRHLSEVKESPVSVKARELINEAYYSFDSVFTEPVREARLIHGDFKMKNVLIDPKTFKLTAMLDPMGCCYGDRESDLFPYINHPADVKFNLLENYASTVCLSDKFPLKNMYYFLWNEVKLYVFMGYCMNDVYERLGENIHNMLKYGW